MKAANLNDEPPRRRSDMQEALYAEIHRLVTTILEEPSQAIADELRQLLADGGDEALDCYASYMSETHALRRAGMVPSQLLPRVDASVASPESRSAAIARTERQPAPDTVSRRDDRRYFVGAVLAVAASIVVGALFFPGTPDASIASEQTPDPAAEAESVATLVRATRVQWRPGEEKLPELSRLEPGKRLQIESGQVEILFDSGVELVIAGRADAVIDSSMRVVGTLGKFSARVSERGRGFTIETPATHVIDLGTEFGVEIDPSGTTRVAVFKGAVDLDFTGVAASSGGDERDRAPERLGVGEGLSIDSSGERSRIVAIASEDFPTPGVSLPGQPSRPALVSSVSDNIRSPSGKKFYRIVHSGLYDDVAAYVDREHEWNGLDRHGLPEMLQGADYVMTFNNDKFTPSFELTIDLAAPCTVYVFFDNNMVAPEWLLSNFEDTGVDIGLDQASGRYSGESAVATGGGMSVDDTFSVWACAVDSPQSLHLGGVVAPSDIEAGWNMYGIAATPADPAARD